MSNRHTARSIVLQTLFELDSEGADRARADDILVTNAQEFAASAQQLFPFMKQLLDTALAKQSDIDAIIVKAAPEWPLERIAVMDRNILRLGLTELLFGDREQVPPKVAINEAIELAKEFGGESSGRFVNGVLGAVYKEIGEPGKNDTGKKKLIDTENLATEEVVGAVVYAQEEGQLFVALVHDVFGHWTLPKGKLQEGEEPHAGVVRKVQEEIGLAASVEHELGENTYIATNPEEGKKKRHGRYYLAQAPFDELELKAEGGLDDAQWFKLSDIVELNFYDDILPVITRAVNVLAQPRPAHDAT